MTMFSPVSMPACVPARNTASRATSSGCAKRPVGMSARMASPTCPAQALRPSGVSTTVGEMALTVMPSVAHSSASTRVSPTRPALLAQ